MQKGTKLVLEQVTTTIAAVADTAGERFIDFYDKFMPTLKYIMQVSSSYSSSIIKLIFSTLPRMHQVRSIDY